MEPLIFFLASANDLLKYIKGCPLLLSSVFLCGLCVFVIFVLNRLRHECLGQAWAVLSWLSCSSCFPLCLSAFALNLLLIKHHNLLKLYIKIINN